MRPWNITKKLRSLVSTLSITSLHFYLLLPSPNNESARSVWTLEIWSSVSPQCTATDCFEFFYWYVLSILAACHHPQNVSQNLGAFLLLIAISSAILCVVNIVYNGTGCTIMIYFTVYAAGRPLSLHKLSSVLHL